MLMRPLERPIFDNTREWLAENPNERFLLVIDEAHLYRGAAGAEVALLVRRFRIRLGIPADRLQVICTSASFNDPQSAARFGAQLTGKSESDFSGISGVLLLRSGAASGTKQDAEALAAVDLKSFYDADSDDDRIKAIQSFLEYRKISPPWHLQRSLHDALVSFPVMMKLINKTMTEAQPLDALGWMLFEDADHDLRTHAITVLLVLGSLAARSQ